MEFAADNIQLRIMRQRDISLAMRLKSIANWNQSESDWKLLLNAGNGGNFVAIYQGKEIGTTTTLPYQNRFSWIGMVLVDPAFRGLGIGTALLKKAVEFAKRRGNVRLDATPQGKKLYETWGFQTERELVRLERKAGNSLSKPGKKCSPIITSILDELIAVDTPIFGADRGMVLRHLFNQGPAFGFYVERNGKITGYCLGRSGSNFEQIGPIVAENQEDAINLLLTSMESCQDKPIIVDVLTEKSHWLDVLNSLGFKIQRPFIRMYLGKLDHSGDPGLQYAIAGPEFG